MFTQDSPKNHQQYLPNGYRKKSVSVAKVKAPYSKSVASDWSGGSKSYYTLYKGGKGDGEPVGGSSWGKTPDNFPKVTLEAGDVLVESGVFCGKTSTAHITYCVASLETSE
jgi:hypothetical protein